VHIGCGKQYRRFHNSHVIREAAFPLNAGTPDAQMNPKKKIFETVQPQLHTNAEGVACYKDAPFTVAGKGVCRSQTMKGTGIK
jgi:hypothetical protein